jgi:DNA-binding CsgD family transcriptional regulator/tetratricopeptide (TPR) repeat protein
MNDLRLDRSCPETDLERLGDEFIAASDPYEATLMYSFAIENCTDVLRRAKLRLKLGSLFSLLGAGEEAAAQFQDAYSESVGIDLDLAASGLDRLASQLWMNSDTSNAFEAARKLRAIDLSGKSAWVMGGYLQEVRLTLALGDKEAALGLIAEAEESCDATNVDFVASLLELKGMAYGRAGDADRAVQLCESACALASKRSDPHSLVFKLNNAACTFRNLGLMTRSLEMHEKAIAEARGRSLGWRVAYTEGSRAGTLALLGDFAGARDAIRRVRHEPKNLACKGGEVTLGLLVGVRMADDVLLDETYDPAAIAWAMRSREPQRIGPTGAAFVEYYRYRGMEKEAAALLHECLETISSGDSAFRLLICAGLYGTEYDRLIARRKFAGQSDTPPHRAYAKLFDAICLARSGNRVGADEAALEAYEIFKRLRWRYYEALALEVGGHHGDARSSYAAIGAVWDLRRLRAAPRPVGRPRHWRGRLSEQQRTIAALVAGGAGNRDVAAALGISTRTVKYHLSEIYHHYGIESRQQLSSRVASEASA